MSSTSALLALQNHLQKSLREWHRYYKRNEYHNKALDQVESELLFFASFTNIFSLDLRREVQLTANALFKKRKDAASWVPFCNHIFIKVLDWSVNGIHFQSNLNDREIFYRFVAMSYSINPGIKRYGQQLLFCLLTKSNWNNPELVKGVLTSCKGNITSSLFSLDYILSVLAFLDTPKKIRGEYLVHCIKFSFKDLNELEKYYNGLNLLRYKFENPFYPFYSRLLAEGKKTYREIYLHSKDKKVGAQLKFNSSTSGLEIIFLKDTARIEKQIDFLKHFVTEASLQKFYKDREPHTVPAGESYSFVDPPSSANDTFRS